MVAHLARVMGETHALRGFVGGFDRFEVRGDRRLGVDDDIPLAGQLDDEVGAQLALLGRAVLLLQEIAVIEHAGHFDDALQLQFAPATAHGRLPQGFDEVRGLVAQHGQVRFDEAFQLLVEGRVGRDARSLDVAELDVDFGERFLQRADQIVDGLVTCFEIAACALLEFFERRLGELQESLVVVV